MTEEKRLGRYEIVRELGRGGMGIVLEGRDPMIDRPVALKIIKLSEMGSAMEEKELKERFFIEAKAAGRLIHPHIVTIYDVGEEEGKSFMAMEFVEGEDLAGIVSEEGPIPLARAAKIVAQVADGLAYAHEHHIVHRDIKPGNILITKGDRVKITDFGLARLTTAAGSVTQTGHAVGSPSYMSPEQVQGHPIDGRSDLFSLGVLFYELVTGRRPFVGEGLTNIIFKIIQENPPLVSTVNPQLPKALDRVVEKLLAKRPDERYRNGHEVAAALAPFTSEVEEDDRFGATIDMATSGKTVDFESDKILEFSDGQKKGSGALIGGVIVGVTLAVGGIFYAIKGGGFDRPTPTPPTQVAERAAPPPPAAKEGDTEEKKPAVAQPATLTVAPSVAGTLFIDGTKVGKAPVKEIETAAGKHRLKVTADGYTPWEMEVNLAPGEKARFAPKLALAPASLLIDSTPEGVEVTLDEKPVGKTPLVIPSLKPGKHPVTLSGEGWVTTNQSVTISAKEPTSLTVKMVADTGAVVVTGPKGASIYIGGAKRGTAPTTLTLPTGRYAVALVKSGYHTKSIATVVKRGETVTLDTTLVKKGFGSLRVTSIPWAEVWINGEKIGPTPRTVEKVEEGDVKVELKNPGYRPWSTTTKLVAGATGSVSHTFTEDEEIDTPKEKKDAIEKGTLLITSTREGVVFIDGRHYGDTPVKAEEVAAGDRKVVIKREGLPDYTRTVTVVGGIVTRLAVE